MNEKILVSILAVVILAFVHPAEAQRAKKVPRIGLLATAVPSTYSARIAAFANLPAWLAKEAGIFAKNGLDVSSPMSEEEPWFRSRVVAFIIALVVP